MSDLGIGKLIECEQERDAIHVAVAPVVAAMKLSPGQDIGFVDDDRRVGVTTDPIGIVDPFLKQMVCPDQTFWMFLYPNTVVAMRHHWQHPAFGGAVECVEDPKLKAQEYIESMAERCGYTYERIMEIAERYRLSGFYEMDNSETYKETWEDWPEFWRHYETLTGKEVIEKDAVPFTCSC